MHKSEQISGVPSNIITGFLGAGKTSTILQLLKNKPESEKWAVLVNEFGEIGIDGSIIEGQFSEQQGVYIREVPGGCMCCTAGLPMRVALTQLIRRAKPDRLLIEPTGLGHPKEVLDTLRDENFRGVIAIQKIVTLLDARNLSDQRYLNNETFAEQIAIADIVLANKQDLYSDKDKEVALDYLTEQSLDQAQLLFTEQGLIEPSLLDGPKPLAADYSLIANEPSSTKHQHALEAEIPECGYLNAVNRGEGFASTGWRFDQQFQFDQSKLFVFLSGINADRLKATFVTQSGSYAYNLTKDALTEVPVEQLDESRIEIIANELNPTWEQGLFACVVN